VSAGERRVENDGKIEKHRKTARTGVVSRKEPLTMKTSAVHNKGGGKEVGSFSPSRYSLTRLCEGSAVGPMLSTILNLKHPAFFILLKLISLLCVTI
jgi:hypothetical protein